MEGKDALSQDIETRNCVICGNQLKGRQTKFCSDNCRWKDHENNRKKIQKTCPQCGKEYLTANTDQKYCSLSCTASASNIGRKGELARHWNGGRRQRKDGYVLIYDPEHPMAQKHGEIYEHRKVAKERFPFTLPSTIPVHHINGDNSDNRPENVEAIRSQSAHMKRHHGRADWKDG